MMMMSPALLHMLLFYVCIKVCQVHFTLSYFSTPQFLLNTDLLVPNIICSLASARAQLKRGPLCTQT